MFNESTCNGIKDLVSCKWRLKNEGFCDVRLPLKFSSAPLKPTPEKSGCK